ncbi:MAG: response regulator [Armatimonadetes bacterium]|nr:response regulator [Armatimonadota bacterium]
MARRTLLVSGGFGDRMVLRDVLSSIGCQVVGEAKTIDESLEKYQALEPDLVVMDAALPDVDGAAAVRRIIYKDPNAVILICAGNGQRALAMDALSAGARDFVVKPLNPRKVLKTIQLMSKER